MLGIRRGVVAITKADLVDDEWLALVVEDVRSATERALPDATIIATSTTSGRGIDDLRAAVAPAGRDARGASPAIARRAFAVSRITARRWKVRAPERARRSRWPGSK